MFKKNVFLSLFLMSFCLVQQAQAFNFMPGEQMSSVYVVTSSGVVTITTRKSILMELGLYPDQTTSEEMGNKIFDREEEIEKKNKEANKK